MERINIDEKFALFSEQWQPKIVAELNGQEVKLVTGPRCRPSFTDGLQRAATSGSKFPTV